MKTLTAAIAEDSEIIRERLLSKLYKIGCISVIWQAANGIDAVRNFEQRRPDIIIIDVQMPGLSGIEVMQKLNRSGKSSTIFIVLTNYPLPAIRSKCFDAGADYFFDKTTEFDKVIEVLKNISVN